MTNINTAIGAAMQLADQYAAAHAKWALEDLYGTSKSYTAKMLKERHALRSHLAAALASAAAPAEQRTLEHWRDNRVLLDQLPAQHPIAPDVSADLERSDWTPEEALRWYAAGKYYDTVPNGDGTSSARILDNGAVASNALKAMSREYAERKGDVALSEQPDTAYAALPMQFACSGVHPVYSADQMRAFADGTHALRTQHIVCREFLERMLSAMEGVIDVADRQTDEFEALRSCVVDLTLMLFKPEALRASRGQAPAGADYEPYTGQEKLSVESSQEFARAIAAGRARLDGKP